MILATTFYKKIFMLFTLFVLLLVSYTYGQSIEIYVSDAGNFSNPPWKILKFDENGDNPEIFIDTVLAWPQDIVFLEDQQVVLISNLNSGRITKYNSSTGNFIGDFAAGIAGPTRMKIGADSLLYVLQWSGNGKVRRYKLDGTFVDEFTNAGVPQSIGLDWDSNGKLYVSSYGADIVRKFDTNGNDLGVFVNSNLQGPTNIWFDDNGDLLVIDYDGTGVKRFNSSGNFLNNFITGLGSAEGVDFFSNGNILVGNGATSSVKLFDSSGIYIEDFIPSGSGNLMTPNAVVIRETNVSSVSSDRDLGPNSFILEQNYPNPFNPTTTIKYELAKQSDVKIFIYDQIGQKIETLFEGTKPTGRFTIQWDLNDSKNNLASGIYFLRLIANNYSQTIKMMYLK